MISCDAFRARFHAATEDPALLDHVRSCDRCLDFAGHADPDILFRALGGTDMIPPGGVDAFVDDVMRQVRVRGAETTVETPRSLSWSRRLAVAATLAVTTTAAVVGYQLQQRTAPVAETRLASSVPAVPKILTTKAVVETYDSQNATIVEVPSEGAGADDVKIVMIFDENLPADL